jgi:glycosyltransferase involved in cell wall biosynthesis
LAKYLAERGDEIYWISPPQDDFLAYKNVNFCEKQLLCKKLMSLQLFLMVIRNVFYIFSKKKIVSNIFIFGETPAMAAIFCKMVTSAKLVVGVRSNVFKRYQIELEALTGIKRLKFKLRFYFENKILRLLFHISDMITVQTESAKVDFLNYYGSSEKKLFVIENDLPRSFIDRAPNVWKQYDGSELKIIFIGNGTKIKGLETFLSALSLISYDFQLTIVGVSTADKNNFLTLFSKLESNLNFIERSNNIAELMLASDLLVVPSQEDQFPNVVLEALAIKLPTIGSNVDGIAHMIHNPKLLFEADNKDDLVKKLNFLFTPAGYKLALNNTIIQRERFNFEWEEKFSNTIEKKL